VKLAAKDTDAARHLLPIARVVPIVGRRELKRRHPIAGKAIFATPAAPPPSARTISETKAARKTTGGALAFIQFTQMS
jgi:hypothetical protein